MSFQCFTIKISDLKVFEIRNVNHPKSTHLSIYVDIFTSIHQYKSSKVNSGHVWKTSHLFKKKHAFLCPGAVAKGVDGAAGSFEPGLRGVEVDRGAAAGGEKKLKDINMYGIYIYIHSCIYIYIYIYIYTSTMYMMYINTNMSW